MADLPVRTSGSERRRTLADEQPLRMRADPYRPVVPWSIGDQEPARFKPDFQIETTEDGFVFKADLAGIKENEVDVAVTGNRLTINGHIYDAGTGSFAGFTRVFTLPEENDGNDEVRAALERGVLTVRWWKGPAHAPEAATRPGEDAQARWESEGGTTGEGRTEPRPGAGEVGR
ncbi:MAG TPA: Hsp20 family protein [Polyangia bacterium]|jgi:HSP20 family protein|nr:Hsp20 family protein [Polyangia bacterium]